MRDDEVSLGGYLLLRQVDRRPVDSEDETALRIANRAANKSRAAMPYGRGNVDRDQEATQYESFARQEVASELIDRLLRGNPADEDPRSNVVIQAALASRVYGAGNCQEHAANSALAYGSEARGKRRSNEEIHVVARRGEDHGWVEVRPLAEQPTVVIDAWADGPAVLVDDSRFAKDRDGLVSLAQFDTASASRGDRHAKRVAKKFLDSQTAQVQHNVQKVLEQVKSHNDKSLLGDVWSAESVIEDQFAKRVLSKMGEGASHRAGSTDGRNSLMIDLHAVSVAMSLGSSGVANVVDDARRIRRAAHGLASSSDRSTQEKSSNPNRS